MAFLMATPDWKEAERNQAENYIGRHRKASLFKRIVRAGNTGTEEKEYEFEPLPESEPVKEPTPAPAPQPEPAPA